LEKFTLGERVKSPGAVNLPLDLAIALLSDNEGKINFAVPVSGNVDNPQFQYGHLIRKAIINLITKIVTSPFRALGGLFGGKGEQVGDISFYPGKDRLQPSELKKLEIVAEALKKRPQLNLAVLGRFDSKADGEAIRTERVNRALAERMQDSPLSPEEEPEMIEFDDAKTQRSLEKQLETVGGKKAIGSFKTEYEKSSGKKPKPVKSYMAIFGRESSDTGYYEAIFKELVRLEPLIEKDLLDLARRRADAIINAIISIKGFDRTRVTAGTPGPSEKASKETVNTKLTLEVLKTTRN
jgi:hypothetical protein